MTPTLNLTEQETLDVLGLIENELQHIAVEDDSLYDERQERLERIQEKARDAL